MVSLSHLGHTLHKNAQNQTQFNQNKQSPISPINLLQQNITQLHQTQQYQYLRAHNPKVNSHILTQKNKKPKKLFTKNVKYDINKQIKSKAN